ncbi:hypothetical protein LOAG_01093 [Loa loa]|uniref:Uncharacterized protein n=1 Tax=Loa loa TaxID=7209 RepID=A0A1S0UAH0_LOALO|nr:hypothetical protein LOAG_01093 [Loa loa]EFO27382.1 hypothetical protein LOAG_01093 [Loa loa]
MLLLAGRKLQNLRFLTDLLKLRITYVLLLSYNAELLITSLELYFIEHIFIAGCGYAYLSKYECARKGICLYTWSFFKSLISGDQRPSKYSSCEKIFAALHRIEGVFRTLYFSISTKCSSLSVVIVLNILLVVVVERTKSSARHQCEIA